MLKFCKFLYIFKFKTKFNNSYKKNNTKVLKL